MDENLQDLPRNERRKILREQEKVKESQSEIFKKVRNWGIGLLVLVAVAAGGYWLFKSSTKPLPGETVVDQGREHIPDGEKFEYNSNPPTSGSHYGDWTRAGVYDKPISDGHLVHSLEHGYIILSYSCTKGISNFQFLISNVYAHEEVLGGTAEESTESAKLSEEWESNECKDLISKLTSVFEKKGKRKLIVIPRPSLDTRIALTAWSRIDKFNDFDEERIIKFIDAFRDKGPEQTME